MDQEMLEIVSERFELALDRLSNIKNEKLKNEGFNDYFHFVSEFLLYIVDTYKWAVSGQKETDSLEKLKERNLNLYKDILPQHYEESFANPSYAVKRLGQGYGQLLSCLYYELRSLVPSVYEGLLYELVIRLELFLEVYGAFLSADESEKRLPKYEEIKDIMYYFFTDYAEEERQLRFEQMVYDEHDYAGNIVMNSDLNDISYLYRYGEYITDNEVAMAEHMNSLSEEDIKALADTYTEGYRIGFGLTGKDITIKKTVSIEYLTGFERMVRCAVNNFQKMGLRSVLYRSHPSLFNTANSARVRGYFGASANKQYEYDHKDDNGLFMDGGYNNRRLEAIRSAGELCKEKAKGYGGPAVIEVFGEKPFEPSQNPEAVKLSEEQKKMLGEYRIQASLVQNNYIIPEERSYTIIAFPVPEIGPEFKDIFNETVRINTLDYKLYRDIQQKLIDSLDKAKYCIVKGMGANHTDIKVMLHKLNNPDKETNFENCVADVNIPVGEVFTSPLLEGTEGVLHVSSVYLRGLLFKNLEIKFENGVITDYSCDNFEDPKEGRKYISDNVLYNHNILPLGEFAIGTNTTAYVMARKFDIADKLPILIAEKTGPHFAVGDTCYSHEEDIVTYNPDGKSIIARENEISAKRNEAPDKAYFGCHTDITIPYDELGELSAVLPDGSKITIIEKGRFVLEGTLELNKPLDER
ncbi:MAG: aminopeptidase [Butyrivibrio sp.]|nr:aminopeptidase [Butyrivibrio sp.]